MSITRKALVVVIVFSLLTAARVVPLVSRIGGNSMTFAQSIAGAAILSDEPGAVPLKSRVLRASNDPNDALHPLTQLPRGERRHMIVQLDGAPDAEAREVLAGQGVKLLGYIGHNAWFATVDGGVDASSLWRGGLKAAWKIEAADRLAPAVYRNRIPRHAIRKDGSVSLSIEAFDDADLQSLAAEIRFAGGVVDRSFPGLGVLFVRIPPQFIWSLGLIDGVHWVEPIAPRPSVEMDRARAYLGVTTVQAAPFSLTGSGVRVSVHDSGHAFQHFNYDDRWIPDSDPLSVGEHASLVAGTIAGDGFGNPAAKGMAPAATIYTYNFDDGSDNCCEANNYADIADALTKGLDIANNSWGYPGCASLPFGDYTAQARVFDRQVLGKDDSGAKIGKPTVVVFSAGNERDGTEAGNHDCISQTTGNFENYGTINQPKPAKNIIVVGAVDSANDRMTSFSSWGPTSDGRIKPDIVAAGVHEGTLSSSVSTITNCIGNPPGSSNQQCYRTTADTNTNVNSTSFDDRFSWISMTSGAAAMVSGSAALFIEDFRANTGRQPLPSTVKAHFIHTARDLNDSTSWYNAGPDYASGYGVLQMDAAINQERSKNWSEATIDDKAGNTFYMDVPASSTEVKITLVWDDAPADPASTSGALVNDLDLIVTDPSGRRAYPWTLNPAAPSDPAVRNAEDHLNNVEMVQANGHNVVPGLWKVQVKPSALPGGPQKYSLVYSHKPAGGNVDLIVSGMGFVLGGTATNPTIGLNASIKNQGPDQAGSSVAKYYFSRNTTFDSTDVLIGQRSIPALAAGATSTATTTLTVPPNLSGTYYVLAIADATEVVHEYFETNNIKFLQVPITF